MGAAFLCAALLTGLPLLTACGGNSEDAVQIQTVDVRVTDHHLEMPDSLPTGPTKFQVTNTGSHDHSFGITGPNADDKLEAALKPGETATLEMFLDIGTYRVYCPVDENQGHTMQIALNVHPETGGSTGG
jgi:uncharacterized cupredoxin-like copper-binding protein